MAENMTTEYEFTAFDIRFTMMKGTILRAKNTNLGADLFHTHTWYELFAPIDQDITLFLETDIVNLKAGEAIVVSPNTLHYAETNEGNPPLIINFSVAPLKNSSASHAISSFLSANCNFPFPADKNAKELLYTLNSLLINNANYPLCGSLLCSLLLYVSGKSSFEINSELLDSRVGRMYKIEQLFYRYYNDNLSLQEIADTLHISVRQLSRIFEKEYGVSFREKKYAFKMDSAKRQLALGKSVSEVSHDLGYSSVSAFHKAFLKHFGVTPSFYRKQR